MKEGPEAERESIARRLFEAINGTDPAVPWAPGGWEGSKTLRKTNVMVALTIVNYERMAEEARRLMAAERQACAACARQIEEGALGSPIAQDVARRIRETIEARGAG